MNQILKYICCFLFTVFLLSCNNEESVTKATNEELNQIKKDLDFSKFSSLNITSNIEVNWKDTYKITNAGFTIYETQANEKSVSSLQSDFLQSQLKYEIILIEIDEKRYSYFVEIYSNKDSEIFPETITKLSNFTGTLNTFSLKGENLGSVAVINGQAKNISENSNLDILTNAISSFSKNNTITKKIPLCDKTYSQTVYQDADRFEVWTVGTTLITIKYVGTVRTSSTVLLPYPCDGSVDKDVLVLHRINQYTHIGAGSYNTNTAIAAAQRIEDNINGYALDPCTKTILDKLKSLQQSDIASMINRFNPPTSPFNITMSVGQVKDNNPNNWAQTSAVDGQYRNIKMVFNQDYINGKDNPNRPTDLSIATTMAHEIIHAYLISLLEEDKHCGTQGICDFPTVYDAYVQQKITNDKSGTLLANAHHEVIANNYVYAIAATIQEFHTGQTVNSGFPNQVYLDMAWGGLRDTEVFNKNYPNDPTHKNYKDRERILARINTEKFGSQYGITSPLGTPCKK
jgi:hypothetical protein